MTEEMTPGEKWARKEVLKFHIPLNIIIEALSLHSGHSENRIKDLLVKTGDIGDAAYIVCKNKIQKQIIDWL